MCVWGVCVWGVCVSVLTLEFGAKFASVCIVFCGLFDVYIV